MRSGNPMLRESIFAEAKTLGGRMSIEGVVNKTGVLISLVLLAAAWVWSRFMTAGIEAISGYMILGVIGGFILAMIVSFRPTSARTLAWIYALMEGLFLGGISAMFEARYPGLVMQAVMLTFGVFFSLLFAYKAKIIRASAKFRMGVVAATGGIALFYFAAMILGFFHVNIPFLYSASPLGIGFSIFVVIIAALNLVLDFDFIEQAAREGAPQYMEWYAAFGLVVTLVWLYIEILRLLAKLNERR
ncbi:MAG: Bax inhibitor-1/YccA family protein [Candidatus Omnitrophica bacterium]|nr:Bax inhibitor-1/YccA family protein [Candidatus Omnitrophota bacterium]